MTVKVEFVVSKVTQVQFSANHSGFSLSTVIPPADGQQVC